MEGYAQAAKKNREAKDPTTKRPQDQDKPRLSLLGVEGMQILLAQNEEGHHCLNTGMEGLYES